VRSAHRPRPRRQSRFTPPPPPPPPLRTVEPPRSEPPTPSLTRDPRPTTEPDSGAETAAEPAATEEPQSDSAAASEAKETKDTPANRDEDRPYRPGGLYPMGGEGGYTRPRVSDSPFSRSGEIPTPRRRVVFDEGDDLDVPDFLK